MGNSTPWLCKIEIAENIINFWLIKRLKNTKMLEKHEND
tara:strand:+ start:881 stop:997 length:117 start_codon:yes stop_codon:yes gene_type:complete